VSRPLLKHPIAPLAVTVPDAAEARVQVRFGLSEILWRLGLQELEFIVTFQSDADRVELLRRRLTHGAGETSWNEVELPLGRLRGRSGELRLETKVLRGDVTSDDLILWAPPALRPVPRSDRLNIVLFSIDTLRPDHLGSYGYERNTSPTLDRLARAGALFRQAIASSSWTLPSHASMLTGLDPVRHGAVRFSVDSRIAATAETVTEILWKAGYATGGFTDGGFVSAIFGFDRGFDIYVSGSTTKSSLKNFLDENTRRARQWIHSLDGQPFFLFLHTYAVHVPYAPPPPYDGMFDRNYDGPCREQLTETTLPKCLGTEAAQPRVLEHIKALYDGEIRSMDAVFGDFLDQLDGEGVGESTCIIVTSDHGEEFMEHGRFFHDRADLYDELIRVPLIVYCPRRFAGGRSVDQQVGLTDIAPTILALAGIPAPPTMQGTNLMPVMLGDAAPRETSVVSEVDASIEKREGVTVAVRTGRYKLIDSSEWNAPQLYDLHDDPGETRDLNASSGDVVRELRKALEGSRLSSSGAATATVQAQQVQPSHVIPPCSSASGRSGMPSDAAVGRV
jgi:arylsulfatase A-like enzyme